MSNKEILTFNIRYDNPDDGPDSWENRKDDVCIFLLSVKPDIIGLQEALNNQVMDINNALGPVGYKWFGVGRDDGKEAGEYNPIFYNANKFKNLSEGVFWLSLTPDTPGTKFPGAGCNRICQYGKFQELANPENTFWHFNTHLDNASLEAREYGATLITKQISEYVNVDTETYFLTGDFNSPKSEETYKIVLKSGLHDSEDVAEKCKPACTFTGFDNSSCEIIDFIFVRNVTCVDLYQVNKQTRPNGRNLSDHRPVQCFLVNPWKP